MDSEKKKSTKKKNTKKPETKARVSYLWLSPLPRAEQQQKNVSGAWFPTDLHFFFHQKKPCFFFPSSSLTIRSATEEKKLYFTLGAIYVIHIPYSYKKLSTVLIFHGCPKYLKYIKYLIPQKIQYLILQVLDTLFFFLVLFYLFSLCQVLFSQKKRQVLDQVQKKVGT